MVFSISMLRIPDPLKLKLLIFTLISGSISACTAVKPYQRAYLNDPAMQTGGEAAENFEQSVFSYREGGLISIGSKGKGGCGCN